MPDVTRQPSSPRDSPPETARTDIDLDSTEFLGPLLHALAESLDVQEIFARISAEARRIVPHDFLMLGLLSEDHQRVRVTALSGDLPGTPGDIVIPDALRIAIETGAFILNDVRLGATGASIVGSLRVAGDAQARTVEYDTQPLFRQLLVTKGLHAFMRVAVRLRGGVLGGLIFCSTSPNAYVPADLARARQIADCVGLAVAHQRLAEAEQRSAEARERAARLEAHVRRLTVELDEQAKHRVLGRSASWRDVLGQATKVAATEATVLLCGESGTGKEVVARFIHRASPRADGPFVALNCAALPEHLLESELFGHEKGAFTGALAAHPGKIEQASGGVRFLDEVGEMSPAVQAKFLRVLQEREYQRAVILCDDGLVTSEHLPLGIIATPRADRVDVHSRRLGDGAGTLDAAEREMILRALQRTDNNKSKAARLLGLTRGQLRSRIEKHGLEIER